MELYQRILASRYRWFLQGLPDLPRALALLAIRNYTMTSPRRAKLLWDFCRQVIVNEVPGDLVECGVWRGGSAGLMGLALKKFDPHHQRRLHLFDSFEGLPQPGLEDGTAAAEYSGGVNSGDLVSIHQCEAGLTEVRNFIFHELGLPEELVVIHQGWFQNTIPQLGTNPGQIALLRLDGDWYESTKVCLDHLYDRVPAGGIIVLDDYYCWEGCKKATDEFCAARGIVSKIIQIDVDSGYWIKTH